MYGGGRGRPPMFGGGGRFPPGMIGNRHPLPSPKPPMGGGRPPRRGAWDPPNAHGGIRRYSLYQ